MKAEKRSWKGMSHSDGGGGAKEDQSLNRASTEKLDSIHGMGEGHPRAILPHGFVAVSLSHIPAAAAPQP